MKRTLLALAIGAISAGVAGGVLAEEAEDEAELNGDAEMSESQDTDMQGSGDEAEATEAQTEESADQGDTDDLGSDQQTETTEEQTEEGAGQGDAADTETDQETQEQTDTDMQEDAQNPLDESIGSMQASELEGMTIVNQDDEEIGDIQNIAKHDESGELFAVVTVGGFWGFGGDEIALPLEDMQMEDDQLVMQSPYGEDEIEESADDYDEDSYSEVEDDMTLSEAREQ